MMQLWQSRRYREGRMRRRSVLLFLLMITTLITPASIIAVAQSGSQAPQSNRAIQLKQALNLADHGDLQAALALVQQLLEKYPGFVPAIKLKAMLLEESGQANDAAALYEQGLKLAPNDPDLLLKAGIYKLAAGDKEEAVKLLLRCSRILPQDGDAQFYLAQAYHLNGQDDLALRAIRQSAKAEPDNASVAQKYGELLCSTRDFAGGLKWLLKAKAADPKLAHLDYDLAWADYSLMDLPAAAEYATRAVHEHPNDANALMLLASTQVKLEHWQDAEDAFQRALALTGPGEDLLLGLGHCMLELKNYQAAVENLQAALRIDPTQILAHFYLSRAYAGLGKTADAEREAALHHLMMEQATFVRSRESEERESAIQAQTRQFLTEHHEQAALNLYREHFKGTSATPGDAYIFVGKTYLFMGDAENGLRDLHYALKIEPRVRGAHTYEGILALKSGDLATAESDFNAELANDPNYQTAIAELGEVRYRQRRWSEAAEQLSRSHTMTPELLYMLCDSYLHLGKPQDAGLTAELVAAYGRDNRQLMQDLIALLKQNGQDDLAQRISGTLIQ